MRYYIKFSEIFIRIINIYVSWKILSKNRPNLGNAVRPVGKFLCSDIGTIRTVFEFGTNPEGVLTGYFVPGKSNLNKSRKNDVFSVNFWPNRRGKYYFFSHFPTSQLNKLFFKRTAIKFQGEFGGLWA